MIYCVDIWIKGVCWNMDIWIDGPMELHVTNERVTQYFGSILASGCFMPVLDSFVCEVSIHAIVVTFLISLSVNFNTISAITILIL